MSRAVPLQQNGKRTFGLAVDPRGERVAMGDEANRVVVWNLTTKNIEGRLSGGDSRYAMRDVAFVPNSSFVAGVSTDGAVRMWDVRNIAQSGLDAPPPGFTLFKGTVPLDSIDVSKDGRWLATVDENREIRVYDVGSRSEALTIKGPPFVLGNVAFSPDASLLAVAGGDGAVYVWSRSDGQLRAVLPQHANAVNSVRFTPDSGELVTASGDGTAAISECRRCGVFDDVLLEAETRVAARGLLAANPTRSSG